jgi:hypothetical protein
MNTIWLKIAGVAVVAVIVIVVLGRFTGNKSAPEPRAGPTASKPAEKPKTFYDMADRDKQFGEAPQPVEPQPAEAPQPAPAQPPAPQPTVPAPLPTPPTTAELAAKGIFLPSAITQPTTLFFKPLGEIDEIEAQRILPYATTGRSLGRLPVVQYGLMVKACRQILERWPDSWYAFRAKQMLEEISDRYAQNYHITPQEMDISRYLKPRPGTQPFNVEPLRR